MNEDVIIECGHKMAYAIASEHFHEQGLMDDQVPSDKWEDYEERVYEVLMNAAERWME